MGRSVEEQLNYSSRMDNNLSRPATSCPLECCECGAVVGTEGPQRGTLLLPCQHILHMGCVEFIKRRGKLFMGMESADVEQDNSNIALGTQFALGDLSGTATHHSNWARQMHGRCLCPACCTPITHIIPLYLRSEDDPGAEAKVPTSSTATAPSASLPAEDYHRVHAAQKRVLLRLRGLCEQRRRMTELTHACANLHEQRARHLSDVEKEERCFPGLLDGGAKSDASTSSAVGADGGASLLSSPRGLPIEHMGVTELELYMAQVTPRLLRTQAEVRKERQLVERRTKKLNALRSHYHATKELQALNAEITSRQARVRGSVGSNTTTIATAAAKAATPRANASERGGTHANATLPHSATTTDSAEGPQRQRTAAEEIVATPSDMPARKKLRGEEAIDVDDEPPAVVVEVLSRDDSGADEPEVVLLDDVDDEARVGAETAQDHSGGRLDSLIVGADDASTYEAPYLIPCYVRTSTSANSTAEPKAPHTRLMHNHVRMLPRREDRLWQPSLQF